SAQQVWPFGPRRLDLAQRRQPLDLVDPLSAVQVRRKGIALFHSKRLEQEEPRARQMRRDKGRAVGAVRRPPRGLLVAEIVEAVAKEHGVEAKNFGERRDSAV